MDVVDAYDKKNDIAMIGSGQNDLEDMAAAVAKKQGRYISAEDHPEAGYYYRSDHFNFAKAGVPALDCGGGVDVVGKGKAYGSKQWHDDYNTNRYHRPADEYNSSWTFAGGIQDMQMLFSRVERSWLANQPSRNGKKVLNLK